MSKIGMVLSGGGARGAYQVGVLQAVADIANELGIKSPFSVFSGVSAGSINAAYMASFAHDFSLGTQGLAQLWGGLSTDKVFTADVIALGKKLGLNFAQLSFGKFTHDEIQNSLLDTAPLFKTISQHLNYSQIQDNITKGILDALVITAMDYRNSQAVSFLQGKDSIKTWDKPRRKSENVQIQTEHIMASSAIPLLFPPIKIDQRYFGDGCVRNSTPCSPSIRLGANHLLVIGVRRQSTLNASDIKAMTEDKPPSLIRIINVLLNSVMLDGVEHDVERLKRINQLVDEIGESKNKDSTLKKVNYVWISPSVDIGQMAFERISKLPRMLRFFLKAMGHLEDATELVSYLMFDSSFCKQLIEIGYNDGLRQKDEIKNLLLSSKNPPAKAKKD